jgi:hypothetical protein
MVMYLASAPVYTIMLIGRWSSDAFLCYIRKQVEQFSKQVAKQMLTFQPFRTTPDIAPLTWFPTTTPCNATIMTMPR